MTARDPQVPDLDLAYSALFFDLDGTLAPIADTPDAAEVPASTLTLLAGLQQAAGGALAVVSGRAAASIDRMLHPLRVPLAGLHGAQWRGPDGQLHEIAANRAEARQLLEVLQRIASRLEGVRLEDKGLSYALHYRQAPQLETAVRQAAAQAAIPFSQRYTLQHGKMVVELKPRGASKGRAIERLMADPPFAARTPVMAGDDLTDEPAFDTVNRLGGVSIKIGEGGTCARFRLADPAALATWLNGLLARSASRA